MDAYDFEAIMNYLDCLLDDCPFCGGEAHFYNNRSVDDGTIEIRCSVCDVRSRVRDLSGEAIAELIKLWNKRVEQ